MEFLKNIATGLKLDNPNILILWSTPEDHLSNLLSSLANYQHNIISHKLLKVKTSTLTLDVTITYWKQNQEIDQFYIKVVSNRSDYRVEYIQHNQAIEYVLGHGTQTKSTLESVKEFPVTLWDVGDFIVEQSTFDHFGMTEVIKISRKSYIKRKKEIGEYV